MIYFLNRNDAKWPYTRQIKIFGQNHIFEFQKNFRIFHGIRSHEGVCYPENEDAIYKQKYTYFTQRHITEACSAVGAGNEGRRPEEIF
jgi:hypothetical protein